MDKKDIIDKKQVQADEAKTDEQEKALIMNSVSELIVYQDLEQRIIWTNRVAGESVDKSPEELIGLHCYEVWHQRNEPCLDCPVTKAMETGQAQESEIISPDHRIYSIRGYPVFDDTGNVKKVVEIALDITEPKRAEEALRESEERWRSLVQNIPDIIVTVERDGTIQAINRTITGAPLDQIIGRKITDFLDPEGVELANRSLEKVFEKGETDVLEILALGADGPDTAWYEARVVPVIHDNRVVAATIIGRDITERKRAEEALRESEERWRSLVQNVPDIIVTLDRAGVILAINRTVTGIPPEETIGKTVYDFIQAEDSDTVRKSLEEVFEGGKIETLEILAAGPRGPYTAWYEVRGVPIKRDNQVIGATLISRDITEKKQAEGNLRESEEKYRLLLENAGMSIVYHDLEGKILLLNNTGARKLGGVPDDFQGKYLHDFFPPDTADEMLERGRRIEKSGQGAEYEDFFELPSEARWFWSNLQPVKDPTGTIIGIQVISHDITERKLAEQALAEEKERLSVTLRSIGDGVITTGIEGNVLLINKVAERLTGWSQGEAQGRPITEVFNIVNEKNKKPAGNPVDKVLEKGKVVILSGQMVLISRDGIERLVADSGAPILDRDSKVIGVILVFRDITEKRRMEEELTKTDKLESLGILAGGIAHDFNNILTALLGNISVAKGSIDDKELLIQRLTKAEKACLRAKDLTQQLLTFSRGGVPVKTTASLGEILQESAEFVLRGSNVRCEFELPKNLWPVKVDVGQISQVIGNFIINADQAMPKGGTVQVDAKNINFEEKEFEALPLPPGPYIKITIRDQGIGIPEEYIKKIFDPFFTTKQKGSGLGLSTSYSIILRHGGYISVDSELGDGSAFYIYIPASPQEHLEKRHEEKRTAPGKGRILVMDDEESIREMLSIMLSGLGYDAEFASSGEQALEVFKTAKESGKSFDVVILDLTVPGKMGGKETLEKLMEIDRQVKAIVSSGYSTDPVMADYKKYGFKGVAAKPYDEAILSKVIKSVVDGKDQ